MPVILGFFLNSSSGLFLCVNKVVVNIDHCLGIDQIKTVIAISVHQIFHIGISISIHVGLSSCAVLKVR